MHKQTFPYEEIGNKDRRRFAQAASRIFHLGGQRSLRDVFQLPFFYHRIDTAGADFIWDGGSGPSACLLLLTYEAYLCEEST